MQPLNPAGPPPLTKVPGQHRRQQQTFTPGGLSILEQLLGPAIQAGGKGVDFLSQLASGDESMFAELEAPAYSAFKKGLGQTASYFTGQGGRNSSAFQNAVGGQLTNLAENIQAKRFGIRSDAVNSLLGLQQSLMSTNPYDIETTQRNQSGDKGDIMQLIGQYGPTIARILMSTLGGPPGQAASAASIGASMIGR